MEKILANSELEENMKVSKNMKTIAQQLNVTDFPFEIIDKNGNQIYFEDSDGYWSKRKFDSNGKGIYFETSNGSWAKYEYNSDGKEIYYENSTGYWVKWGYDSNGNEIYWEDSDGYWRKREFDSKGNKIYLENLNGVVIDNQPNPSCEGKIVEIDEKKYKLTEV